MSEIKVAALNCEGEHDDTAARVGTDTQWWQCRSCGRVTRWSEEEKRVAMAVDAARLIRQYHRGLLTIDEVAEEIALLVNAGTPMTPAEFAIAVMAARDAVAEQ